MIKWWLLLIYTGHGCQIKVSDVIKRRAQTSVRTNLASVFQVPLCPRNYTKYKLTLEYISKSFKCNSIQILVGKLGNQTMVSIGDFFFHSPIINSGCHMPSGILSPSGQLKLGSALTLDSFVWNLPKIRKCYTDIDRDGPKISHGILHISYKGKIKKANFRCRKFFKAMYKIYIWYIHVCIFG